MAILAFLYTQNLGLHLNPASTEYQSPPYCRPQLWMWMHEREWSAYARGDWETVMVSELNDNVWAAPFFHLRFQDVVRFKVYDGRALIAATPELHEDWDISRSRMPRAVKDVRDLVEPEGVQPPLNVTSSSKRKRKASSEDDYDRLSVTESDLVRFVLCHKYGGIYLDVDTLLLRDWEELWGWQGAFGYRWSRLAVYNTAVLRLHRQSALGTFLLRTAYRNGMDFHPFRVTRYALEAQMDELFAMAPVALFDPAWLDVEEFERDRPPQPHFTRSVGFSFLSFTNDLHL